MHVITDTILEQLAFTSYLLEVTYDDDICLEDVDSEYIRKKLAKWHRYYLPSLNEEHSGDCTNQCNACTRCYTERFINLAKLILKEI